MQLERALLQRARGGDRDAFCRLATIHREAVYRAAYWVLKDPDEALDATQEAFLKAFRHLDRFEERAAFKTWVRKIATNVALDRQARRARRREREGAGAGLPEGEGRVADPRSVDPEAAAERSERQRLVRTAIEELPPAARAAVLLRDVDGLSYAEIAATLEIPKGTVMSRLHHGRKLLKEKLSHLLGPRAEKIKIHRAREGDAVSCAHQAAGLLSALIDGELTKTEEQRVRTHVADCATCREELHALEQVSRLVGQEAAPLPDADAWSTFGRGLEEAVAREPLPPEAADPRGRWVLAAAAAAVVLLAVQLAAWVAEPRVALAHQRLPNPTLDYEAPEEPRGRVVPLPPLADVLDGELAAEVAGSASGVAALASHGLVQRAAGTERLADLYPLDPPAGAPAPLATADASLALWSAAAGRAALTVDRQVIRPSARLLVEAAVRQLGEFEERSTGAVAVAARAARERLAVAAVLLGLEPVLPGDSAERVAAEVALVRAGDGEARSPLLGRDIDYAAFVPRGIFADDEELADYARAVSWLRLRGLRYEGQSARQASLIALALAHARLPDGRSALAVLARMEAATEVFYGPPDGLTTFDVLTCLRVGLGRSTVSLGDLESEDAVIALVKVAQATGKARGLEMVRSLPPPAPRDEEEDDDEEEEDDDEEAERAPRGPSAPIYHLLGGTRTLEGMTFTRLTAPQLPLRREPTSLDLLVLLGSSRARMAVSAMGADPMGYDQAVDELRGETTAWRDPSLPVPVRTSLEQGRLWAIAALFRRRDPGPAPFQSSTRYRSRILLAALAGLNGVEPAPDRVPPPPADGPVPLVEPLPDLHARLAFSARRLVAALEQLLPRDADSAPAYAALERVARLEEALRDASLDTLAMRELAPDTRAVLRGYAATVGDLVPGSVLSAEDVYVYSDGQALHRVVARLDQLAAIAFDPEVGRPRLAVGAALVGCELTVPGRLTPAELPDVVEGRLRGRPAPRWADHVVD